MVYTDYGTDLRLQLLGVVGCVCGRIRNTPERLQNRHVWRPVWHATSPHSRYEQRELRRDTQEQRLQQPLHRGGGGRRLRGGACSGVMTRRRRLLPRGGRWRDVRLVVLVVLVLTLGLAKTRAVLVGVLSTN